MSRNHRIAPLLVGTLVLSGACRKAEVAAPAKAPPPAPSSESARPTSPGSAAAPATQADAPAPDRKAAVEAALKRYGALVLTMDDEGISEMYTADGEMGSVGTTPSRGRAAILRNLRRYRGYQVVSEVLTSESVTFDGNDARQTGTYSQVAKSPGGKVISARGKLEAVWTLEPDGVWRLRKMMAFPDSEATPGKPKR